MSTKLAEINYKDVEGILVKGANTKIRDVIDVTEIMPYMEKHLTPETVQKIWQNIINHGQIYASGTLIDAVKRKPHVFPYFVASIKKIGQTDVYTTLVQEIRTYYSIKRDMTMCEHVLAKIRDEEVKLHCDTTPVSILGPRGLFVKNTPTHDQMFFQSIIDQKSASVDNPVNQMLEFSPSSSSPWQQLDPVFMDTMSNSLEMDELPSMTSVSSNSTGSLASTTASSLEKPKAPAVAPKPKSKLTRLYLEGTATANLPALKSPTTTATSKTVTKKSSPREADLDKLAQELPSAELAPLANISRSSDPDTPGQELPSAELAPLANTSRSSDPDTPGQELPSAELAPLANISRSSDPDTPGQELPSAELAPLANMTSRSSDLDTPAQELPSAEQAPLANITRHSPARQTKPASISTLNTRDTRPQVSELETETPAPSNAAQANISAESPSPRKDEPAAGFASMPKATAVVTRSPKTTPSTSVQEPSNTSASIYRTSPDSKSSTAESSSLPEIPSVETMPYTSNLESATASGNTPIIETTRAGAETPFSSLPLTPRTGVANPWTAPHGDPPAYQSLPPTTHREDKRLDEMPAAVFKKLGDVMGRQVEGGPLWQHITDTDEDLGVTRAEQRAIGRHGDPGKEFLDLLAEKNFTVNELMSLLDEYDATEGVLILQNYVAGKSSKSQKSQRFSRHLRSVDNATLQHGLQLSEDNDLNHIKSASSTPRDDELNIPLPTSTTTTTTHNSSIIATSPPFDKQSTLSKVLPGTSPPPSLTSPSAAAAAGVKPEISPSMLAMSEVVSKPPGTSTGEPGFQPMSSSAKPVKPPYNRKSSMPQIDEHNDTEPSSLDQSEQDDNSQWYGSGEYSNPTSDLENEASKLAATGNSSVKFDRGQYPLYCQQMSRGSTISLRSASENEDQIANETDPAENWGVFGEQVEPVNELREGIVAENDIFRENEGSDSHTNVNNDANTNEVLHPPHYDKKVSNMTNPLSPAQVESKNCVEFKETDSNSEDKRAPMGDNVEPRASDTRLEHHINSASSGSVLGDQKTGLNKGPLASDGDRDNVQSMLLVTEQSHRLSEQNLAEQWIAVAQENTDMQYSHQRNTDMQYGNQENTDIPHGNHGNTEIPHSNQGNTDMQYGNQSNADTQYGYQGNTGIQYGNQRNTDMKYNPGNADMQYGNQVNADMQYGNQGDTDMQYGNQGDTDMRYGKQQYFDAQYDNLENTEIEYATAAQHSENTESHVNEGDRRKWHKTTGKKPTFHLGEADEEQKEQKYKQFLPSEHQIDDEARTQFDMNSQSSTQQHLVHSGSSAVSTFETTNSPPSNQIIYDSNATSLAASTSLPPANQRIIGPGAVTTFATANSPAENQQTYGSSAVTTFSAGGSPLVNQRTLRDGSSLRSSNPPPENQQTYGHIATTTLFSQQAAPPPFSGESSFPVGSGRPTVENTPSMGLSGPPSLERSLSQEPDLIRPATSVRRERRETQL